MSIDRLGNRLEAFEMRNIFDLKLFRFELIATTID